MKVFGHRIQGAPDLELGLPRPPLDYNYVSDDALTSGRPLVFCIPGWGMRRQTPYMRDKLLPYLVDQGFDVVLADHHSLSVKAPLSEEIFPPHGWHQKMRQRFGAEMPEDLGAALRWLYQQGITDLPTDPPLISGDGVDYQSFGLMAAMDYAVIYGDLLARDMPFDRQRVIAFGSSNGGYIGMLMLKFLPNSLSAVIENSSFVAARREDLNFYQSGKRHRSLISGALSVQLIEWSPWNILDPTAPNYFGPSHEAIRDLRHANHFEPSNAKVISYHSSKDKMVPAELKASLLDILKSKVSVVETLIGDDHLDGIVFKTLDHGMNASLRGLFRLGMEQIGEIPKLEANDFQRATVRSLHAETMTYGATFSSNGTVEFTRQTRQTG